MLASWYDRQGPAADVLHVGELPDPAPPRTGASVRPRSRRAGSRSPGSTRPWARRNVCHLSSRRPRGGRGEPLRILRMVPAPVRCPGRRSSPWIRTTPQVRLSVARRTIRVEQLQTPYIRPQENGNRDEVRWTQVTDAHGPGLRIDDDHAFHLAAAPPTRGSTCTPTPAVQGIGSASVGPGRASRTAPRSPTG